MEISSAGLKHAVIVGGGLIGIEMAEMFLSRDIGVTLLVRESGYYGNILPREEADVVGREIRRHGVDLRLESELSEIIGDGNGAIREVITFSGERITCGFVGITIGVSPRIEPFNTIVECDRGILVDDLLRTNVPNIFAAGDCVEMRVPQAGRRAIEPVWYTGRMMGEVAAYNACGNHVEYEPGIWFNSAKFFDIEYQVYGDISPNLSDAHDTIYWEHENGNKSIRMNFRKSDHAVTGFNLLGVRYRQEVCEKWIANHMPMTKVLPQLALANFDPEFSHQHESALIAEYNVKFKTNLKSGATRNLNAVLKFLNA
jgi:NADPH-dependent 2,4-dienoyl-CoA reductase/sulfur reductase-like enzyme